MNTRFVRWHKHEELEKIASEIHDRFKCAVPIDIDYLVEMMNLDIRDISRLKEGFGMYSLLAKVKDRYTIIVQKGMMEKRRVFYIYLFTCIFFITGLVNAEEQKNTAYEKERLVGIPNPAAAYSSKLGYKNESRKNEYGGEYGVVIFPDGTECGEWGFFRGKAGQKWSYCEQHGGKIENRVENMETWTAEYAVCVFPDGSECDEMDYMDGKCGPGVYKKWSLDEKKCIKK